MRWRIYLQSYQFLLRHIKKKDNVVADWASRMLEDGTREEDTESGEMSEPDDTSGVNLSMLCLVGGEDGQ